MLLLNNEWVWSHHIQKNKSRFGQQLGKRVNTDTHTHRGKHSVLQLLNLTLSFQCTLKQADFIWAHSYFDLCSVFPLSRWLLPLFAFPSSRILNLFPSHFIPPAFQSTVKCSYAWIRYWNPTGINKNLLKLDFSFTIYTIFNPPKSQIYQTIYVRVSGHLQSCISTEKKDVTLLPVWTQQWITHLSFTKQTLSWTWFLSKTAWFSSQASLQTTVGLPKYPLLTKLLPV